VRLKSCQPAPVPLRDGVMASILTPTPDAIERAAAIIRSGGLVGLPTETVYGLAADARNGEAVARIFSAKGRPAINPLIVHVAKTDDAERLGVFTDAARALATELWPGPLTMILHRQPDCGIADLTTAGLPTIAL